MTIRNVIALIRESFASARSQPTTSIVTLIVIAGMVATVLLTSGRTVGAERDILATIDSAGTRTIVVRAEPGAGLDSSVIPRLKNIHAIEWAGAFGPATDVENSSVAGGTRVPVRSFWQTSPGVLDFPSTPPAMIGSVAYASPRALHLLGMPAASGGISMHDGNQWSIAGTLKVTDAAAGLEPLIVVPELTEDVQPVSVLIVVAASPELVDAASNLTTGLLAATDSSKVSIETSADLAALRSLVQSQLGIFGQGLVLGVFGLTAVLVAVMLYGFVMMRRKDFGRRRALGASQGLIVSLLLVQTVFLAAIGAGIGNLTALIALRVADDPLPGWDYFLGLNVLAVVIAAIAALAPAIAAARRDPLRELRVP